MAKKTYADMVREIEELKAEAEALRREEVDGVIERIREAIAVYGLRYQDLYGKSTVSAGSGTGRGTRKKAAAPAAKYSDGKGNTWGGRGPRPQWLRDAVASGATLDSFLVAA